MADSYTNKQHFDKIQVNNEIIDCSGLNISDVFKLIFVDGTISNISYKCNIKPFLDLRHHAWWVCGEPLPEKQYET